MSYIGSNYTIGFVGPNDSLTYNTTSFTKTGSNITNYLFNVSMLGQWFVVVYHNINTTLSLRPINLTIKKSNMVNPIIDGIYYNNTIMNYVRNCYIDKFSTFANSPSNLSSCICRKGYQWNYDFSTCIRNCTDDINSNGQYVYSNCQSQAQ